MIHFYQYVDAINADNRQNDRMNGWQNVLRSGNLKSRSIDLVWKHCENAAEDEAGIHQGLKVGSLKELPSLSFLFTLMLALLFR